MEEVILLEGADTVLLSKKKEAHSGTHSLVILVWERA